jgi:hypothetical protein
MRREDAAALEAEQASGAKVWNVVNDWYVTMPEGVTLGPYNSSRAALALISAFYPCGNEADGQQPP